MGGHCHVPAQIIRSAVNGVPTLVLIRKPADAVASLISRWPYVGCRQALHSYVRFYAPIEHLQESVLVASFDDIVGGVSEVVDALNQHFETSFDVPEALVVPANTNQDRVDRKHALRDLLREPRFRSQLAKAEEMYQRISRRSCVSGLE